MSSSDSLEKGQMVWSQAPRLCLRSKWRLWPHHLDLDLLYLLENHLGHRETSWLSRFLWGYRFDPVKRYGIWTNMFVCLDLLEVRVEWRWRIVRVIVVRILCLLKPWILKMKSWWGPRLKLDIIRFIKLCIQMPHHHALTLLYSRCPPIYARISITYFRVNTYHLWNYEIMWIFSTVSPLSRTLPAHHDGATSTTSASPRASKAFERPRGFLTPYRN